MGRTAAENLASTLTPSAAILQNQEAVTAEITRALYPGLSDDAVPALQRSQIERLAAKERKLLEERGKAKTAAEREAIDAELAGVRFQMNQYAEAMADIGEPVVVVRKPRTANMTAVLVGGLLVAGVVGGAVWLARR